jgi:hypothetical protein
MRCLPQSLVASRSDYNNLTNVVSVGHAMTPVATCRVQTKYSLFLKGLMMTSLKSKHVALYRLNYLHVGCVRRTYTNTLLKYCPFGNCDDHSIVTTATQVFNRPQNWNVYGHPVTIETDETQTIKSYVYSYVNRCTWSFRPRCGPRVDSASNTNECQGYFLGVKAAGAYGWQPYHLHVPSILKSGSLKPLGPFQACIGEYLPSPS